MNPNRVQAGVPTGGRFAAGTRSESGVALLAQPQQPADLPALAAEIRRVIAEREAVLEPILQGAGDSGRYHAYDDARGRANREDSAYLHTLLEALSESEPDQAGSHPASGGVANYTAQTSIEGSFGEVIVSPRDGKPGTVVMIDSSAATDGQPLVVMINDQVYDIPVDGRQNCPDCGRYVDSCKCLHQSLNFSTTLPEINNLLRRAYRSALAGEPQGELMVQRLSAHAAAKVVRAADPDACYLDLDWAPSGGLEPVAVADAFGDASAPAMEVAAVAASYTGNLHGDLLLRSGSMTVAPPHSGAKYRLDLDKALGTEIW